jgi:hypothetical protein
LAITGHGVPDATIQGFWGASAGFFAQPLVIKQTVRAPQPGYPYGYLGPLSEALAASKGVKSPPDLKERFNGGPLSVPDSMDDPEALAFCMP